MANAGVAAGGTLSDMFWNPATLGDVKGLQTESVVTGILPFAQVTTNPFGPFPISQNNGTVTTGALVPASYIGYRLNQNIIFGLGVNSPFGLTTSYAPSSFINLAGIAGTTRIFSLNVNPNVAYQFNDQFTIAVGLQGQYLEALESAFSQPSAYFKGATKSIGFGYTLGVDWKPMAGTKIGLGYRSGISNTLNGAIYNVQVNPAPPPNVFNNFAANLKLKTPGELTLGVAQDVGEQWTLRAGVIYTNWATLSGTPVSGPAAAVVASKIGTTNIPFNYKDTWGFSTGAEYKLDQTTTLRAGIGYETSPVTSTTRSFRLPDSDRVWLSAGLSYAITKSVGLDAGYSFLQGVGNSTIASGTSGGLLLNGPASGSFNANVHILSLALKVKFD
jgi:long-chain fatty acid transport protein